MEITREMLGRLKNEAYEQGMVAHFSEMESQSGITPEAAEEQLEKKGIETFYISWWRQGLYVPEYELLLTGDTRDAGLLLFLDRADRISAKTLLQRINDLRTELEKVERSLLKFV